ncbi:MAG: hypothetical protein KatS3mg024_1888 [Armatimonadota bacterium]|nr:MAG: hypothetical protein KatS3mg024_1888 [Armatimonadota bacterium]
MERNIGRLDRNIRLVAGAAIIGGGLYYGSWLGLLGLLPIVSAITGRCGLYCPLGISTVERDARE